MNTLEHLRLTAGHAMALRGGTEDDTEAKVNEMQRETYVNRRKSSDKIHQKVVQLMMS
ncbi:MAG: hypothetical protein WBB45_19285 [Cyclobacteriaceae bacterium]